MKKIIVISLFVVLGFAANGWAQSKRIVREIVIKNNKVVSEQTIISQLQTKVDADFSPTVLSDDIKRLYATGLLRDVSAEVIDVENGVNVILTVEEKPMLKTVKITGNRCLKTKLLRKEMKIKETGLI